MICRSAKFFAIEIKKKICSIAEQKQKPSDYTLIFYITTAKIIFCMLHDFNLDEFMPQIIEQMQRLFRLRNLSLDKYSSHFHFDQNLWEECCHPYNTEFHFCKEWQRMGQN